MDRAVARMTRTRECEPGCHFSPPSVAPAATKRRKAAPVLVATEHQEQSMLFQWAELAKGKHSELAWLFAIPNFSGRLGKVPPIAAIKQAQKLNAEGRKKGVPDVMLPVARGKYHGLFVELKRTKGGDISLEQLSWHSWLERQGYLVFVALGWEQARDVILDYLALAPAGAVGT
jgi:hypothetical protein